MFSIPNYSTVTEIAIITYIRFLLIVATLRIKVLRENAKAYAPNQQITRNLENLIPKNVSFPNNCDENEQVNTTSKLQNV